ncbi:asparagine synthetase B, partial [Fibrobacterota bacterium]
MKFTGDIFSLVKARNFALFLYTVSALLLFCLAEAVQAMILVPMDGVQTDHLKAYGVVYHALKEGARSYWLLNYRGGSFAIEELKGIELRARKYGVTIEHISKTDFAKILTVIENNNMEKVTLEKAPDIAVYIPPATPPWDDAVVIALKYAEIPYDTVYDKEVLAGRLSDYDW